MKTSSPLRRDESGVSAIEFALIMPLFFGFLIGMTQLAVLYWSNADVKNAVAAGARLASTYKKDSGPPPDSEIIARINQKVVGLEQQYIVPPTITRGEDADGNQFADISMGYKVPLNFVFYKTPPVELTERRRVYLQVESDSGTPGGGSSGGGSAPTSSAGGDGWGSSTPTSSGTTTTSSTSSTSSGADDGKDKDKKK